ncbi:hypothetical protein KBX50_05220 [Micromonospora sp. C51]|uniref:hypothetical protein n=1 Tax=Micromonospora sp. C51 TaxID=2824879 RepID=UPI001B371DAE|nr:hypothetical protein [Micromonospora sp. C51]MBQ1047859.1 hypothetical protein [Micromonospora sp. C51]
MAETVTNRGKYRALLALMTTLGTNAQLIVITGTQVGVNSATVNTVADLDAIAGVAIHTERKGLGGATVAEDDVNNRAALDYANLSYAAAPGVTAQGVALIDGSGASDAARDVLAIFTTGFPQPMDGGLNINIADLLRAS